MNIKLPRFKLGQKAHSFLHLLVPLLLVVLVVGSVFYWLDKTESIKKNNQLTVELNALKQKAADLETQLETLKNEDQRKTNQELRQKIIEVEKAFKSVSGVIEILSDARLQGVNVGNFEKDLASALNLLASLNYGEATAKLIDVTQKTAQAIASKSAQIAALVPVAAPAQDLPAAGSFRKQSVATDRGTYSVSLIAEPASSVKMITDSANDETCADNCPTMPLASFVSRNGGFAGINGSYFCPPDYPSCAGKVNSYNTLFFNARNKKYMNSDQNQYSTVPMVVQNADRSMRFMGQSLEWGRDTGIIGGIANQPMLVSGSHAATTDSSGYKGNRGFIAVKSGTLYIGVVHGANIGDAAAVLATLGVESALNLDGGGSSALIYNGKYVVGPGRSLPNAVILAR